MIHLAPHVLKDQFTHPKYYKHFMKFNSILKCTIQYSFTEQELDELEQDIIKYVKEYERCASFVLQNFSVSICIFIFILFLVEPMTHFHIIVFTTSFWPNALPWSSGVVHFYQPSNHGKSHLQVLHCGSTRLHSCLRLSINST